MLFYKLTLKGLPSFEGAIEFSANSFCHLFPCCENQFEIGISKEGCATKDNMNKTIKIHPQQIIYQFKDFNGRCYSDTWHKHISIVSSVPHEYEELNSDNLNKEQIEELKTKVSSQDIVLLYEGKISQNHYDILNQKLKKFAKSYEIRKLRNKSELMSQWYDILSYLTDICLNKIIKEKRSDLSPSSTWYCEKACKYISSHLNSHVKVSDIANEVNISENYLQGIFKQVMNMSIIEYTNSLKLEKSKYYFINTDASVADVAEMFGFKDPGYFGRLFYKKYQMTIKDFKAIEKKKYIEKLQKIEDNNPQ